MVKRTNNIRLIKEEEKIRQVTHWDMDYLPRDEILEMYKREKRHHGLRGRYKSATDKNSKALSLLMIATGLLLLAVTLYVSSLI